MESKNQPLGWFLLRQGIIDFFFKYDKTGTRR